MNLKQLRYFMAVCDEHQITAAAAKLHIAQPPLSYELSRLEQDLGVRLLKRGQRGVEMTDAGKVLYMRAEQILAMTTATEHEMENYGKGMSGVLSIGAISSSGGRVPNTRMESFTEHYPDIRFELHEGNTFAIIDLLEKGIVDIGIVRTPFSGEKFNCRYSESEPMVALFPEKYCCGKSETEVTLAELSTVPLVIYRRYEQLLHEAFERESLVPFIACLNDDARTTYIWSKKGFGVGIVPRSILDVLNPVGLVCKNIVSALLTTQIALIWKKDRYLPPPAQKFVDLF